MPLQYPTSAKKILMLNLIETEAKSPKSVVRSIKNVTNSYIIREPSVSKTFQDEDGDEDEDEDKDQNQRTDPFGFGLGSI